jgi:amino acid adenylation domain-containing protein
VPGGAANVQDVYPLAPLQEGILFHHLLVGRGDPYVSVHAMGFETRARLDAYLAAFDAVIARHDILRTALAWDDVPEPVQVVWRRAPLPVEEVVLDPADGPAAQQLAARCDPRRVRLDVRRAPLVRAYVARDVPSDAGGERWVLLLLRHHLIGDHTTVEVLREEIAAHLAGEAARLPAPVPFRTFVAQVRLRDDREAHERYFRALLGDVTETTAPFGLLDTHGDGAAVVEARALVDAALGQRLRAAARALGVSAASVCHLAWAQVLARASGREDVVFGTVLYGRMQGGEGAERAPGIFINTLPVRIRVGDEGAAASVRATHARLAALLEHEHASLAVAQQASGVPAPTPLFSALLNYRHSAGPARESAPAGVRERRLLYRGEERTNYPLALSVDDAGTMFRLVAQAPAAVGPARVCALMHRALETLVDALEKAPETPVAALDVLPASERQRVVEQWNATAAPYPDDACLHELIDAQVARTPDAVAVVLGDEQVSFAALAARANRLAHHLRTLGVGPDARVALCMDRRPDLIVGMFAILKAGGAYVPLDPTAPADRLRFLLADSGAVAVLTAGNALPFAAGLPVLDLVADRAAWAAAPATCPPRGALGPEHLAYLIYTSGSTGTPKGVMVPQRAVGAQIAGLQRTLGFSRTDRVLQFASPTFDASVEEIFGALLSGATLVLRSERWLAGAEEFWAECARHRLSVVDLPTRFWQMVTQAEVGIPECVRLVYVGGEALEAATIEAWHRRPGHLPVLANGYGPTETTVNATTLVLTADEATWRSIGRPLPNVRAYVLDARGEPVPAGAAGELYIGGAGVARGYLGRPGLTAERFVADAFGGEPGARLYRTGDVARWRMDGTLEFLGRADFQVKVRGYRIELGEIEARLGSHPGVTACVVLLRAAAGAVAGEARLVAYYVARDATAAAELQAYLGEHLPDYMVPAAYVRLDALPLTANGKLDRRALPEPGGDAYALSAYEAPVGETETELAEIWAEVLRLERVGRHDHFFALGGHSLSAVSLLVRVRSRMEVNLQLTEVFEAPVLAALAQRVLRAQLAEFDQSELSALASMISNVDEAV